MQFIRVSVASACTVPNITARAVALCRSFRAVVLCAAAISVVCFVFGMTASYVFETPSGASVVAADLVAFAFCSLVGRKG